MDQTVIWDVFGQEPESLAKIHWHTTLPHGNTFLFCLGAGRPFTDAEAKAIQTFCDTRFGADNWKMNRTSLNGRLNFRDIDTLVIFLKESSI